MLNLMLIVSFLLISNQAVQAVEESAEFYFKRGVEHAEKGQLNRVIAHYDKALEINPKFLY